jgi:fatty acid desaturase
MPDSELAEVQARYDRTARMARWFDVKEHWVALGLVLTLGCLLVLRRWEPGGDEQAVAIAPVVFAMAATAAATAWFAAIVGLVTSSYRAVG